MSALVPVYEWTLNGSQFGCGTRVEFDYWKTEGVNPQELELGKIIAYESAREDDKRRAQWGLA